MSLAKLKLRLREKFPALVRLKEATLDRARTPAVQRDPEFFAKHFRRTAPYNFDVLDPSAGLVIGSFDGTRFVMQMEPGNFVESSIFLHGTWEPHISALIDLFVHGREGIVFDIGANVGASVIPLAKKNPGIAFKCYEPHPVVFKRLEANIGLNGIKNIVAVNAAVSSSGDARCKFYAQKASANMGLSSMKLNSDIAEYEVIEVDQASVDRALESSDKDVLFIKIDTQGTEADVLRSAEKTIRRFRPAVLFEFEESYFRKEERAPVKAFIQRFFEDMGYQLFSVSPDVKFHPRLDLTKGYYHGDILALPCGQP